MTPAHPLFVLAAWALFMAPLVAAVAWLDATEEDEAAVMPCQAGDLVTNPTTEEDRVTCNPTR